MVFVLPIFRGYPIWCESELTVCHKLRSYQSCQNTSLKVTDARQVTSSLQRRLQSFAVCQLASSQVSSAWGRQIRGESELLLGVQRSHFHLVSHKRAPQNDGAHTHESSICTCLCVSACTHMHAHRQSESVFCLNLLWASCLAICMMLPVGSGDTSKVNKHTHSR